MLLVTRRAGSKNQSWETIFVAAEKQVRLTLKEVARRMEVDEEWLSEVEGGSLDGVDQAVLLRFVVATSELWPKVTLGNRQNIGWVRRIALVLRELSRLPRSYPKTSRRNTPTEDLRMARPSVRSLKILRSSTPVVVGRSAWRSFRVRQR